MLVSSKKLKKYKLLSLDNEIGKIEDFYFDDKHWTIRYMVANTGNWLIGKQVLVSPYSINDIVESTENIEVNLTKNQIEEAPSLESNKPVSLQYEKTYLKHFGYPIYWGGPYMWGLNFYIERDPLKWDEVTNFKESWDPTLRSTHEVDGYHIEATDGEVGHIKDFIIDSETWALRYLVVSTQNWWPGKQVLISPQWIERVSWKDKKVYVNIARDTIQDSPEYTDDTLLNREYEVNLHQNYQQLGYWTDRNNQSL